MALRNIRTEGDPILGKISKPILEMNDKTKILIGDMLETMYHANGVGLAAVQVGVLKRLVVIDVSEEGDSPIILINPEIIDKSGSQTGDEGCLSVPGKSGVVTRANHVKVKAFNEKMELFELEGDELLARAIQHEVDHLDGILYTSKVEGEIKTSDD
ncbi:MAG: peptide deformylase [Lachnospiraceae bacterium]|nr:peptide deformylase [Lachnospiraceae bacterium]MBR4143975.1 peptide deformylase [Lachnospiraceae bacterium]MBR4780220.1 peptide deformylase [Lachnospiraceae bacterium]MBR6474939.1 peptide deformylase [Lachnospiraceae bacterium]